jgi:hypothetical protein
MSNEMPGCPVCGDPLSVRLANGRKSGKAFVMLVCARDGRHFRGFISHRPYVNEVLEHIEKQQKADPEQ